MQCHVAHTLFDYQRNLRRGKWYCFFLVHFGLMQDARNEEIGLQPEAFVLRPPGYALRLVTREAPCADFCFEYIARKLADCPAVKGWAIVKVGPEQPPKINRYLKSPGVASWLDNTGHGLWMASEST